ncbi:MAG TPA: glycosyltransferase family 4 protein [bacterium]|nr:glycosyltransferase family 4 protein [bacterium]HOL47796.1 glycosyltransferase family 4 protein [bacterium]HPQ18631.1 glycosyltransferase family 4 protein [bacterium]
MDFSILKTTIRFPPAIGGAELYIENIADRLCNKNYKIKIITTNLRQHINNLKFKKDELQNYKKNYQIIRSKTIHIPHSTYHISFDMLFYLLKSNYDIFHTYCIHYFPAFATKFISLLKNKPFFCTPIFDINNAKNNKLYFSIICKFISIANGIIFISEYEKNSFLKFFPAIKKFIIIPPSLDDDFTRINMNEVNINKFNILNKYKFKILFAGRLCYGKGIDILLNAINLLKEKINDYVVILAGEDFGFEYEIKKIINQFNLKNIVIYKDIIYSELKYLYSISDLLVLPSRYEAFGIVIIEAMAFKLPVIAMNNSAIPYLIENNKTGLLFENENYKELAEKIFLLLNTKNLKEEIINYSYDFVKANFNWNNTINNLISFYKANI